MTIYVAGENDAKQILPTAGKSVEAPTSIGIDFSNVISYSVYLNHAVLVLNDGTPYALGDNTGWPIYSNLGKNIKQWKPFNIVDNFKRYLVESAVCGSNYTLYLVKEYENDSNRKLAYVLKNKQKGKPHFLNTLGWMPISIYGGSTISACIDERGAIHIITESIVNEPNLNTIIFLLPGNNLPISVCFQDNFVFALSSLNKVYVCNLDDDLGFTNVAELNNISVKMISGTSSHCIAVCNDGTVYSRGCNEDGRLGSGNKKKSNTFNQILVLSNIHIVEASAGAFHTVFINKFGKVYTCGFDGFGECLLGSSTECDNLSPKATQITSGARFCIAGKQKSVVFVDCDPPSKCPNRVLQLESECPYPALLKGSKLNQFSPEQFEKLRSENLSLHGSLNLLNVENSQLKNLCSQLKSENLQLANTNKQIKKSNTKLKKENNNLRNSQQKMNELQKKIKKLNKQVESLKKQLNSKNQTKITEVDNENKGVKIIKNNKNINQNDEKQIKNENENNDDDYNNEEYKASDDDNINDTVGSNADDDYDDENEKKNTEIVDNEDDESEYDSNSEVLDFD